MTTSTLLNKGMEHHRLWLPVLDWNLSNKENQPLINGLSQPPSVVLALLAETKVRCVKGVLIWFLLVEIFGSLETLNMDFFSYRWDFIFISTYWPFKWKYGTWLKAWAAPEIKEGVDGKGNGVTRPSTPGSRRRPPFCESALPLLAKKRRAFLIAEHVFKAFLILCWHQREKQMNRLWPGLAPRTCSGSGRIAAYAASKCC